MTQGLLRDFFRLSIRAFADGFDEILGNGRAQAWKAQ